MLTPLSPSGHHQTLLNHYDSLVNANMCTSVFVHVYSCVQMGGCTFLKQQWSNGGTVEICGYMCLTSKISKDRITYNHAQSVSAPTKTDTSKHASLGLGPTIVGVNVYVYVCAVPAVALTPAVAAAGPGAEGETGSVASAEE